MALCRQMNRNDVLGASRPLISNDWDWPVHGLRHPPADGTSGWYVWTGGG
ncbi:immunity protein Imm33 domain-containing protein [Pseudarthrobacter siccitolerans]